MAQLVGALHHKPEGRGFNFPWSPGVISYEKWDKIGRRIGPTTPTCVVYTFWYPQTPRNMRVSPGL
jgi:hypothetical protein